MSTRTKQRPKQDQRIAKKVKAAQAKVKAKSKVAVPVNESSRKHPVVKKSLDAFAEAFRRWRDERVQLSVLAAELNMKRSKLRRSFQQLAGGKPAFSALRKAGAGGTSEPFGGKRATGGRTKAVIALDDSKVKTIPSCRASDGWKVERKLRGKLVVVKDVGTMQWREIEYLIHVAPDGTRYVRATTTEKADLIVQSNGFPPIRLRRVETAAIAKAVKQDEKLVERGKAALKRTRERKRSAKKSRRSNATS